MKLVNEKTWAVQVKVSVKPEVAHAFKAACKANDTTMTKQLSDFMSRYGKVQKSGYAPNLSSRRQRRAAMRIIMHQLERVRENEERYRDNIPENLQGGSPFELADQSVSIIDEALDLLASVY